MKVIENYKTKNSLGKIVEVVILKEKARLGPGHIFGAQFSFPGEPKPHLEKWFPNQQWVHDFVFPKKRAA